MNIIVKDVKILRVRQETPDTKSFFLEKPDGFDFKPGQYVILTIGKDFRAFSMASSPTEKEIMISMKMSESEFKKHIVQQKMINMKGPYGGFLMQGQKHVMLAGGIGIAPFRSMIKFVTDANLDYEIVLLYSNKTEKDIAIKHDLDEIVSKNRRIKIVYTVTRPEESPGWKGITGRVDEKMIKEHVRDLTGSTYYICGPPPMVDGMNLLLSQMKIPAEKIKSEKFIGYQ